MAVNSEPVKQAKKPTIGDDYLVMLAGYICFDDIMGNYHVAGPDAGILDQQTMTRITILEKIIDENLNSRERMIFKLRFEIGKTISDIVRIMSYNNYQTAQKSVFRVVKLIKCYYRYETLPKKQLHTELQKHLDKDERKVLELMHQRLTVFQMKDHFGLHYKKMNWMTRDVMSKLQALGGVCQRYHDFLAALRKFRHLSDI